MTGLDRYITEAAKAAGYEEGFGVPGCDLSLKQWTVAYTRQSSEDKRRMTVLENICLPVLN